MHASLNSELEDAKQSNAKLREELRTADQGNDELQDKYNQVQIENYHYLHHQI